MEDVNERCPACGGTEFEETTAGFNNKAHCRSCSHVWKVGPQMEWSKKAEDVNERCPVNNRFVEYRYEDGEYFWRLYKDGVKFLDMHRDQLLLEVFFGGEVVDSGYVDLDLTQ